MLSKYKADKLFDRKDATKFCTEAMKQASGGKSQNNMLGFDAAFKEIDRRKRGTLEIA